MKFFKMNLPEQIFGIDSGLLAIYAQPFLLIIIILVSISMIVMPRVDEMKTMKGQSGDFARKTKDLKEKIAYLTQVDQAEIKSQTEFLESSLMNGKDSYYLVNIIRKIAGKYGFMVESFLINPGMISKTEVESKLPIKVTIVGSKERYLELLLAIENNLPILSIDSFSVQSSGVNMELTLGMSSYYLSEGTAQKSANVSLADLIMKKEEADVLKRLGSFVSIDDTPVAKIELGETEQKKEFVKYDRQDPFTP